MLWSRANRKIKNFNLSKQKSLENWYLTTYLKIRDFKPWTCYTTDFTNPGEQLRSLRTQMRQRSPSPGATCHPGRLRQARRARAHTAHPRPSARTSLPVVWSHLTLSTPSHHKVALILPRRSLWIQAPFSTPYPPPLPILLRPLSSSLLFQCTDP